MLKLRKDVLSRECYPEGSTLPLLEPWHAAIIEWRAMTINGLCVLLITSLHITDANCRDNVADALRKELNYDFTLPQILESATWKGGREIAARLRPETKGPPIEIISDGTVF